MDLEHALKDPAAEFVSPEAVVDDARLTAKEKRAILEQWLQDAKLLGTAAAENMAGGEPSMLSRVAGALNRLGNSPN